MVSKNPANFAGGKQRRGRSLQHAAKANVLDVALVVVQKVVEVESKVRSNLVLCGLFFILCTLVLRGATLRAAVHKQSAPEIS